MPESAPVLRYVNDAERAYDDPGRVGWLADALRAGDSNDTLVVDGGDSTALGALSLTTDSPTDHAISFFDAVSPAVHVPGNHDFDRGVDHLAAVQRATGGQWLAANVDGDTLQFGSTEVFRRAGERIGVVGVANPDTSRLARFVSAHTDSGTPLPDDLAFGDPLSAVRRGLERLGERGVDHTVVVAHCGAESETIAAETDADVVLGGHDHRRVVETVDGTLLARTEGHGRAVVVVRLDGPSASVLEADTADNAVADHYRTQLADASLDQTVATVDPPLGSNGVRRVAARALRDAAGADVAAVPRASIRGELAGETTHADVVGTVPFRLPTATVTVTGSTLRSLLAAADEPKSAFWRTVWCGADPSSRTVDAAPTDAETYRLASVVGFFASELMPMVSADDAKTTHGPLHEVLVDHVAERDQLRPR